MAAGRAVLDERQAIERLKSGDAVGFEFLFQRHKRRVFNLCLRITNNRAIAEELTQEAFLNVFRRITTFRGDAAFTTWLHRIAANCALMYIREQRSRVTETSLQEFEETDEGRMRDTLGAPDLNLTGSLDRIELDHAIAELPPGYRLVLVLHDIEGYEHTEIGELLCCSVGNTKSQLHKARLKLRRILLGQMQKETPARRERRFAPKPVPIAPPRLAEKLQAA